MYLVYSESNFPPGALDSELSRKSILMGFFAWYYSMTNSGAELTEELAISDCKLIENHLPDTFNSLAWLSLYYQSLPVVRLFFRNDAYELHVLDPNSELNDLLETMMFDEVAHGAVPERKVK